MYEAFFGLKRRPFAATPDPQCFLASESIQAALDEIVVCVEQGQGIAVVSAPAGTGKTLLCERLRSELGGRFVSVLLRHASFLTRRALLQTILCELHHSYRQQDEQELRLELSPAIRALRPQSEALVLICDEAHQLSEDLLEELRILSDLAEHGRPLVRLVLVGQLGLEETLALSSLEALSQRIRADVCVETLTRAGSLDYVDYRLTWAGGRTDEIFTPDALELVGVAADGVPRCINQLCDHALLLAYVAEQRPVSAATIREALQDLRQLPLHWNESPHREPAHREAASFENGPEYEAVPRTHEASESLASFYPATNTALEMESIEIGADLPRSTHSQFAAVAEWTAPHSMLASSITEQPTEFAEQPTESSVTVQCDEAMYVDHDGTRDETSLETPWCWDISAVNSKFVPLAPAVTAPGRSPLSGGFVEELVLDRYAAIDAGLEPPELITSATAASPEVHTADATKAVTDTELFSPVQSSSVPSDDHDQMDAHFDAVCNRLNQLLPQVRDDAGWDANSLQAEIRSAATNDSPMVEDGEVLGSHASEDSMEDLIGGEVCQLADQLHQAIGLPSRVNSSVEQLRSLLSPVSDEGVAATDSVETSPVSTTGSNQPAVERGATEPEMARPYRNLFSMLRRKQQGLL